MALVLLSTLLGPLWRQASNATANSASVGPLRVTDAHAATSEKRGAGILIRRWNKATKTTDERETALYRPRPGDVCVVRFDCSALSPIPVRRNRTWVDEENFSRRTRTWVDGNFNTATGRLTRRDIEALLAEHDVNEHANDDPCLCMAALEFEVGAGTVVRGIEVAVQRMVRGDLVEVIVPYAYGYGIRGHPPRIHPKTDLAMVLHLIEIRPDPKWSDTKRKTKNTLAMFCHGLVEGFFLMMVLVGIPTLVLFRYETTVETLLRNVSWLDTTNR